MRVQQEWFVDLRAWCANAGLHTSVSDLGATGIQFGFCADGSGLFAGVQVRTHRAPHVRLSQALMPRPLSLA